MRTHEREKKREVIEKVQLSHRSDPEEQNAEMSWKSGCRYAEMRSVGKESTQCVQLPRKQQMLTLVLYTPLFPSLLFAGMLLLPLFDSSLLEGGDVCEHAHTLMHACMHTHTQTHNFFGSLMQEVESMPGSPALLWPGGLVPLNPSRAPYTHL